MSNLIQPLIKRLATILHKIPQILRDRQHIQMIESTTGQRMRADDACRQAVQPLHDRGTGQRVQQTHADKLGMRTVRGDEHWAEQAG